MKLPRFSTKSLLLLTLLVCLLLYLLLYKQYKFPIELATSPNRVQLSTAELAELAAGMKVSFDVSGDVTAEFEGLRIAKSSKPGDYVVHGIVRASGSVWQTLPDAMRHLDVRLPVTEEQFIRSLQQAIDDELATTGSSVLHLRGITFAGSEE